MIILDQFRIQLERLFSREVSEAVLQEIELKLCRQDNSLSQLTGEDIIQTGSYILASVYCLQSVVEPLPERSYAVSTDKRAERTSDKSDELEMEGSPLKLYDYQKDFKTSGGSEEDSVIPLVQDTQQSASSKIRGLPVKRARWLVSLYNLACKQLSPSVDILPLYVACDGKNPERLTYLMSHFSGSEQSASNSKEKSTADKYHSYVVSISEKRLEKSKLPSVESLIGKKFLSNQYVTRYSAEYELVGHTPDDYSTTVDAEGQISAVFKWTKPSVLLADPHLDAAATVIVIVKPEDPRSAVNKIYKELLTIQGLIEGVRGGCITWSVKENALPVTSKVKQLIQDLKVGDQKQAVKSDGADLMGDQEEDSINRFHTQRQDLDFTEQLWGILKDCCALSELEDCLQLILDSLATKQLQPMVHHSNDTQLAKLVRESYYDKMSITSAKRLKTVDILIEISLDKLIRDYSFALIGMELVTAHHLKPFITACADNILPTERVKLLHKLHSVVELVTMLQQYIELPKKYVSCAARMALKYYTSHDATSGDKFDIPVSAVSVTSLMKNPSLWRAVYRSDACEGHVVKVILLSTECLVSHVQSSTSECEGDNSTGYYLTTVDHYVDII